MKINRLDNNKKLILTNYYIRYRNFGKTDDEISNYLLQNNFATKQEIEEILKQDFLIQKNQKKIYEKYKIIGISIGFILILFLIILGIKLLFFVEDSNLSKNNIENEDLDNNFEDNLNNEKELNFNILNSSVKIDNLKEEDNSDKVIPKINLPNISEPDLVNNVAKFNLNNGSLKIEELKSNILYVINTIIDNLSISELKIGNISCNITGQENLRLGINFINISLCTVNLNNSFELFKIITKVKTIEKILYFSDVGCNLDRKIINSGDVYNFYNSQTVPYGNNCSYIERTCNEGVLSGNSSYKYLSCSVEGQDIIPNDFNFTDQIGVELNTLVTSNTLIPTGYNGNITVSVTGSGNPKISIENGSFVNFGNISLGQSLRIQLTSSSNQLTTNVANLSFGSGYSTLWKVTTRDYADCLAVDGIQLNHSRSAIFYNSQTVPYGSSCSYISRTCNEGVLSGSSSYQYSSCIVEGQDIIPNDFSFTAQTGVELNALITSNTVFPTGYNSNIVVSVTGSGNPKISIGGGSFVTSGTIKSGQSLRLQLTSSSNQLTTNVANLSFGSGYSTLWKVTTRDYADCLAVDGIQLNHSRSAIFYNSQTVPYGGSCSYIERTCNEGVLSGSSSYQYSSCIVEGQGIIPNDFSFTAQTGVELNALITSNTVFPTGYNSNIVVTITGSGNPKISIGGGSFVTSGTIKSGQSLRLQLTSSSNQLTTNVANLSFGSGYSTLWKVTTRDYANCLAVDGIQLDHSQSAIFYNSHTVPYGSSCSYISRTCNDGVLSGSSSYQYSSCIVEAQDIIPNAFSFIDQTGVNVNTLVTSNTVIPTGYNGNIAVSVTGSGNPKISIGGGSFVTSGTISPGQSLRIQLTSSSNGLTTNIANLAFGSGYSTSWKVTTKYLLNCSTLSLNGGNWITVPGNPTLGTIDFCVMKYEAKNDGSNNAISQASNQPWVSITWQQAKRKCEALGLNYHLITDNEWLTIAKNAETVASNWNSSVVGTGFMYLGHNDNNPPNSLAADTNDSNGYYGTNDGVSSPGDNSHTNFPSNEQRAYQGQKRTLTLQNGEVIWDLAGNVWEWVNDSMPIASRYHGGNQQWMSYSSDDGTGKIASLVPSLKIPSNGWNANQGMGRYYDGPSLSGAYNSITEAPDFCTGYCSPTAVFLRGGFWVNGAYSGAFTLSLHGGPSDSVTSRGFRCSYTP